VGAAEESTTLLDAMADDLAAAVIARRCKSVDGTLEAIEGVHLSTSGDREHFVVLVAAYVAHCHG
jgi:hypothetical protein